MGHAAGCCAHEILGLGGAFRCGPRTYDAHPGLPAARARSKLRARALLASGFFATDPDIHIAQKTEMLDIYRELGDKHGMLVALNALGVVYCAQGNYARARTRFEESVSIAKELGDSIALSHSLITLVMSRRWLVRVNSHVPCSNRASSFFENWVIPRELRLHSTILAVSLLTRVTIRQPRTCMTKQ
jgi:hypothetical protein